MKVTDKAEKVCGVYMIFDEQTDKTYVGSSNDVERRRATHLNALQNGNHYNTHMQNLFNKRGVLSFTYVDLENREIAYDFEQALIDEYKESKLLLNIATDARRHGGGRIPGPETRAKMSAWQIGKKHSPETIAKLKELSKGRPFPQQALDRAKEANANRVQSDEEKRKRVEKRLIPVEVDGKIFDSATTAAKEFDIHQTTAVNRLNSPNFPNWNYIGQHTSKWKHSEKD